MSQYLETAIQAAIQAGELLKDGFGKAFEITNKAGRNNLVTEYDLKAEKEIIDFIKAKFPDHSFLSEECGAIESKDSAVRWIIDPLDGTVNFAHSIPIFSVSIAAEVDGEIEAGVIYSPMLNELFYSAKGKGAFLNSNKIKVSDVDDLNTSMLVTGFPYNVAENPGNCLDSFKDIVGRGIPVRRLGSAALDLAYLAAGRFDGYWEIKLQPWDVAAGYLLVNEAGGKITKYDESEYKIDDKPILATNGKIHRQLSDILMGVK